MFNLSRKFIVKGKITKELKEEFLQQHFNYFWNYLESVKDNKLKLFSHNSNRYLLFSSLKDLSSSYEEVQKLSLKKQKDIAQQFKELGWKGLRPKSHLVPDYSLIREKNLDQLLEYTNIENHLLFEDKNMIIRFLCFLNDKKIVQFPLILKDYPYLDTDDKLRMLEVEVSREIFEEHMFVHKKENTKIFNIIRAYSGDLYDFDKEMYEETIRFIDNNEKEELYSRRYHQFIDTIYYVSSRQRKDLDPDFVINRYTIAGEWFSFDFLNNFEDMSYYKPALEKFLVSYEQGPKPVRTALKYLVKYIISLKDKPKWNEFNRLEHIFDPKRKNKTLMDFLKKQNVPERAFNTVISHCYKFFDFLRVSGQLTINPIFPKEDYKVDKSRNKHGTHRKSINEEVIIEAKKIIFENDFAFAKQCPMYMTIPEIYNHKTKEMDKKVFSPSVAIALYTLLEVPIRGIQVQFLDSGEGDEFRFSFEEQRMIKNSHKLAEKGRSEGFVRKSGYEDFDGEFFSLWITTNKSITDGYEIPYLSEEFYNVMKVQYEYLETYDPNPIKVNKGEIDRVSMATKHPMFYPLFRDLSSRKKLVVNKKKIELFWGQVCLELQKRYEERGITLSLTKNTSEGIKSKFDIHTLRVTGITNLLDKGVPLNLVSRYFAGHSSFAMTLWYNSPRPQQLRDHLEKARNNAINNSEWNLDGNFNDEDFSSNFIGNNAGLVKSNQGFLSIGISGICPYKRCEEGGDLIPGQGKYKPVPMGANGPNCFQCRFFVTGPKFLMGQMIEGNMLIRNIQKKVQFLDELKEQIMDAEDNKDNQKINILKGQKRVEEESYKNMLHEWWSRMKTFEASRKLMENNENSLVVYGEESKPILKEMGSFELLHNITTFGEFFPEFMNFKEPIAELENLLSKFLMKNEITPFILSLDGKEKVKACNLMGDLLMGMSSKYDIDELLEGKVLLKDIPQLQGKIDKLLNYKGR